MAVIRELGAEDCERLLGGGVVGRVAIATDTGPHIVPVNYSVVGRAVIFRTTADSLIGAVGHGAHLAFEVDHVDYASQRGWSVVVRGHIEVVTDPDEVERIRAVWQPRPWAEGPRDVWVKLPWHELSGRRLGDGWTRDNEMPVRRVVSSL